MRASQTGPNPEIVQNAIIAVHEAESIADIERRLLSELRKPFQLQWIRVFFHTPQMLDAQLGRLQNVQLFQRELAVSSRRLGTAVFARNSRQKFSKREQDALSQICKTLSFALDRLSKLDQSENLKLQWETTFNAIAEPLCLTDENFNIIRTNKAFVLASQIKASRAVGKNCFQVINPAAATRQYEIATQPILGYDEKQKFLLILFRDVTDQKKMEKRILASAKMAELGTIGSSIAHDINNPLGGMLSFLQLIKMDLPEDHPMRDDIIEMENAGKRCKAIVENLLRFSRQQNEQTHETFDLREVIRQAVQIMELQTRSLGIELTVEQSEREIPFSGQFNLLSQALSEIMQNAYAAVAELLRQSPGSRGQIHVAVQTENNAIEISIRDNGCLAGPNDLTLAHQIVDQHKGKLEISSRPNVGTMVKITFQNV